MLPRAPGQAPIRTGASVAPIRRSNVSAIANAVPGCLRLFRPSYGPMLAVLLALLFLSAPSALAGPHAGGTLLLRADPGVQYSAGEADGGGSEGGLLSADGEVWVKPSGIMIVDGVWSFLVKTRALHAVSGMRLRIGSTDYSPTLAVETTDSTAVLTFRYEAAGSDTAAFVRLPDGELLQLEILDSAHARTRDQIEGVISIGTVVGAINYPLGARERTLNELEGTDESLLTLLKQLGCNKVSKYEYMKPETLSREDSLRYNVHFLRLRASQRRGYNAYVDPQFSERAVAFILSDNPMVEYAVLATPFRQFGRHDPYAPPNPCFPHQWNAMHSINHGHFGTGVDYVWGSGGRGFGRRIAIVDTEWCLHSGSITYAPGDNPEMGPHLEHGLLMALTACAHANSQGRIPGFAFGAEVIPVFVRGYDEYPQRLTAAALERAVGYGPHVISISGGHGTAHPDLLLAVQACFDAGIPVVVTKGPDDDGSYPANWDQGSMTPLVLSCNTSRKDGSVYHSGADVYGPGQDLVHPNWGSGQNCYVMPDNDWGSFAAPQIAGAIAVSPYSWAAEVYYQVVNSAFNVQGHRILSANQLAGIIGVNDIENVHVEGSGYSVFLKWRVTDPENIDLFRVFEGASCFGPFEEAVAIQPGDPQYTSDGEYYAVSLSAPYYREYYFKLRAEYGELTATYHASGIPDFADWVDAGPPPEGLWLLAHWSDAELSWDRVWDPWHQATEYWVLRRIGDPIDVCHPHSTWGSFFRGVVPDSSGTCVDPLVALRACWYDDDIAPGATYYYRVASVRRDANGIVMWVSELSDEESGSGWEPGSVEDAAEPAARLEVSVSPTPVLRGSTTRLQASGIRGDDGTVALYDVQGRKMLQRRMGSLLRDGRFAMDLEGKDVLRSAGVYFCRVEDDSGQRVERKIVVIR